MFSKREHKPGTIEYLSLGCDKNLVDTERILANLKNLGFKVVSPGKGAEILLITTCGFIQPAKQESIEQILLACERKERGEIEKLVVAGCMVELNLEELKKEIPEVDLWIKFSDLEQLPKKIQSLSSVKNKAGLRSAPRFLTTPKHLSYLKISEGCDRGCRFCIIPSIRGRFHSEPLDKLIEEAKFLEKSGVKELNLVAQDLCDYGKDIGSSLVELIERLLDETEIPWLRLFYLNPEGVTDELLELIASEKRICKYIDLPFQHISERVLKAMGRRARERQIRALISKIKKQIPEVCLRGTALVGFPGEREDDFRELKNFVEEVEFDWLGVFCFSAETEAEASCFPDQVPESVKMCRKEELENLWQELAEEKNSGKIGKTFEVLVDSKSDLGYSYQGRSQFQAYELDGLIQLKGRFKTGNFYMVRIVDCLGMDLVGEIA